jgi:hypothetical protein
LSGGQSSDFADDLAAFGEDRWPSSAMNRTIDDDDAQQRGIRGIDNRVGGFLGDVGRAVNLNSLAALE